MTWVKALYMKNFFTENWVKKSPRLNVRVDTHYHNHNLSHTASFNIIINETICTRQNVTRWSAHRERNNQSTHWHGKIQTCFLVSLLCSKLSFNGKQSNLPITVPLPLCQQDPRVSGFGFSMLTQSSGSKIQRQCSICPGIMNG